MSKVKVKICGLKSKEDIACVNEALPDYGGFIFYEKSKRYVSPQEAAELSKLLDPRIIPVGVFVNDPLELIVDLVQKGTIRQVQLHGDEDEAFALALRKKVTVPIVRAVAVKDESSLENIAAYPCDLYLFDTYTPGYGGSGRRFDLSLLQKAHIPKPYFIAGGLTAENAAAIAADGGAYALDVAGGVETNGAKDREKVLAFCRAVRSVK